MWYMLSEHVFPLSVLFCFWNALQEKSFIMVYSNNGSAHPSRLSLDENSTQFNLLYCCLSSFIPRGEKPTPSFVSSTKVNIWICEVYCWGMTFSIYTYLSPFTCSILYSDYQYFLRVSLNHTKERMISLPRVDANWFVKASSERVTGLISILVDESFFIPRLSG